MRLGLEAQEKQQKSISAANIEDPPGLRKQIQEVIVGAQDIATKHANAGADGAATVPTPDVANPAPRRSVHCHADVAFQWPMLAWLGGRS